VPESQAAIPDRDRVERILAPLATTADGPVAWVEDTDGATLAGLAVAVDGGSARYRVHADVLVDGALIARVVAATGRTPDPATQMVVESLALAIGEIEQETQARRSAEQALRDLRTTAAADGFGMDAAELARGRRQQRSILSLDAPDVPGYDLASYYAAARDIGGDFFELFRLRRRGQPLGIVVADVTGKGLDAAILMAFSRAVTHTALEASRGPAEALERTNRVLAQERRGTLFITALCAVLEPRTGRLRIASAGHEPPLLVPGDGRPIAPVGDPGVLVGMFATLGLGEVEVTLDRGDKMLFYTDGVTDAIGPTGERFGEGRLLATITRARDASADGLVAAVRTDVDAFQGAREPADDVTIVVVGRHRASAQAN
jgi:sigma-B regulation protein RsbU (phosphoserine phosphatase)